MSHHRKVVALGLGTVVLATLVGCAPASGGTDAAGADLTIEEALEAGGELTYWAWSPESEGKVAAFEKAHPNVTVNWENLASGNDLYPKITNALQAGTGAPDVVQLEDIAVPQFALADYLVDLAPYGFDQYADKFGEGSWSAVQRGDQIVGLPEASGPMALLYNKRVFDQFGITVPTTWDEYVEAAKTIHEADPNTYLTSDGGDGLFTSSMIWQAGGHPYDVDGTDITIDLADEGVEKWTEVWNELVEGELLAPTPSYTDDWYKQLGNGQIASLISAAWMPGLLATAAPDGAGDWQVAPMPTYDGGEPVSANLGGSSQVVLNQTENPALAAAFVEFINADETAVQVTVDTGSYPALLSAVEDPAFADLPNEYFGGQPVNQIFVAASKTVPTGWQYLPYQPYAQSIFGDSAGQAYVNHTDLRPALLEWQEALVEYGNKEGYTVTGK
jgi:multiple sugar transport system substrate-binding protein